MALCLRRTLWVSTALKARAERVAVLQSLGRRWHAATTADLAENRCTAGLPLSWEEYFKYKRRRSLREKLVGVPTAFGCGLGTMAIGMAAIEEYLTQPTDTILGMDPFIALGIGSIGSTVLGYYAGVGLSGAVWRLLNKSTVSKLDAVCAAFPSRLVKAVF